MLVNPSKRAMQIQEEDVVYEATGKEEEAEDMQEDSLHKRKLGNRDKSHIRCFNYDKLGYYASDCPNKLLKLQETVEKKEEDTQEAYKLMMHEVV